MAGLLKAVLAFRAGRVPRSLHCETPNPGIPFAELNLALNPDGLDLAGHGGTGASLPGPDRPAQARPSLIGVNSFGFGGTNAHAVLEAPPAPLPAQGTALGATAGLPPLLLSARSAGALRGLAEAWRDRLADGEADAALVRGAALMRDQHALRLAVTGISLAELGAGLRAYLAGQAAHSVAADTAVPGRVAFVFSGNGSQWAGMAADAVDRSPAFRAALASADAALLGPLGWSVAARLREADGAAMRDTSVAQPLLFAVQVALVMALRTAGVQPDACMGHSVGEAAAAWASGALTLDQACRVIAVRSRLQARTAGDGRMAVLGLGAEAAAAALAGPDLCGLGIEIAAQNSRSATTVAGPEAALLALQERAREAGWPFTLLDLDYAFHSAAMDPIRGALDAELAGLAPGPATLPFVSTVAGGPVDGTALDARYWWRNVRAPVRFAEAAAHLVASGVRVFIEVGPQPVLQAYLHDALTAADAIGRVLPTLSRRPAPADPILLIVRAGARRGLRHPPRRGLQPGRAGATACRPTPGSASRTGWRARRRRSWWWKLRTSIPLLGARTGAEPSGWSVHLGTALHPWLADHVVGGATVAPAAMLVEMALAAARARHPGAPALELAELEINRPLVFEHGVLREVRLYVTGGTAAGAGFEIASRTRLTGEPWTVHATGRLGTGAAEPARAVPVSAGDAPLRTLDGAALYRMASGLGLAYGPAFQVVQRVEIGRDTALVRFVPNAAASPFLLPPPLLDGALQGLLALAAGVLGDGDGVLPWRFGRVRLLAPGGTVPAAARLHVTRVGPRSVRADIALLDAAGVVVAELLDGWFVRVALSRSAAPADRLFHTAQVPSATGGAPALPTGVLGADAGDAGEAVILSDAFAALAAAAALRRMLPDPRVPFLAGQLVEDGLVAPAARERLDEALGWLAADGLAEVQDGTWTLLDDDLQADDVLRTLVFDQPRAVADAALLSLAAEQMEAVLRGGPAPVPAPALLDGMLLGSPAGAAAADALLDAVARVAAAWPAGQPLRVLEVGARRGAFTRQVLRRLGGLPVHVRLDAAAGADDLGTLRDALAGVPGAAAIAWGEGAGRAPYDLVVGLDAMALGGLDPEALHTLAPLAPGGTVLLAEPAPGRVWSLVQPGGPRLRDARGWTRALTGAGLLDVAARTVAASWPATLLLARAPAGPAAQAVAPGAVALIAAEGPLADAVAAALAEQGMAVARHARDAVPLTAWARKPGAVPARIVLLAEGDAPPMLDLMAQVVQAMPAGVLTVVAPDGPLAGALAGARRVMANELPDVRCRLVRLAPGLDGAEDRIAHEVLRPDAEDEAAWSAAGRTVPRLRRGVPPARAGAPSLRLSVERPGLLDNLRWTPALTAQPGPGQVSIQVRAAGLNFRDVMWAHGPAAGRGAAGWLRRRHASDWSARARSWR